MLVEFLGWPGSGKSMLAGALAPVLAGSQPIRNWTRSLHAGFATLQRADSGTAALIDDLCRRHARAPIAHSRRTALLRGDSRLAVSAQSDRRIRIADELFLHAVFGTVGPLAMMTVELQAAIAALVGKTYRPGSVAFVYLRPPADVWESRLRARRRGRSRFGSGGDERLLMELRCDRLLEHGIVEPLRRAGFQVFDSDAPGPEPGPEAVRLAAAIERHFRP